MWWVSEACPAPDTIVVDWIKQASFIMMKEVDADGYKQMAWLYCLGFAWLELQDFRDFFLYTQILLLPFLNIFWVEGSVKKNGWILQQINQQNG